MNDVVVDKNGNGEHVELSAGGALDVHGKWKSKSLELPIPRNKQCLIAAKQAHAVGKTATPVNTVCGRNVGRRPHIFRSVANIQCWRWQRNFGVPYRFLRPRARADDPIADIGGTDDTAAMG